MGLTRGRMDSWDPKLLATIPVAPTDFARIGVMVHMLAMRINGSRHSELKSREFLIDLD